MSLTTLLVLAIVGLVGLAIVAVMLRRSWGDSLGRSHWAPPDDPAPPRLAQAAPARSQAGVGPAERAEIEELVQDGNTLEAIKLYRELTGVGLKEAKDAVDALARGEPLPAAHPAPAPRSGGTMAEVHALAAANRKIEAIKLYRELTGVGLKEAKDYVDSLGRS